MKRRIGIVGAGVSGLLACKYALAKGYNPIVFESRNTLGGVWIKTMEITKLQTSKSLYQFSDFPWHSSVESEYPDSGQVFEYLQSYAIHFDLLRHIRFNTRVVSLEYVGTTSEEEMQSWALWAGNGDPFGNLGTWSLNVKDLITHSVEVRSYCQMLRGIEHPCTVICRTPRWTFSNDFPWEDLYMNRFSELMVHKPGEGLLLCLLATILSPLRWGICKFVESKIKKIHRLKKYGMVPKHSFLQEINSCNVTIIPDGYYDNVDKGSIILKRSQNFNLCKNGVLLDNDQDLVKSDLVILATGYRGDRKLKNILTSAMFQDCIMGSSDHSVPLYRQCIHPRIPQLAVIGHSESFSNLYTSELRCRWISELLDGKFKLPSIVEMEKDVTMWDKFMKTYSGKYFRRSCIGALHIWYNDLLCNDMGLNPMRKNGFWAELFEPYGPMDYASTST